jgi:hypothetical protein
MEELFRYYGYNDPIPVFEERLTMPMPSLPPPAVEGPMSKAFIEQIIAKLELLKDTTLSRSVQVDTEKLIAQLKNHLNVAINNMET